MMIITVTPHKDGDRLRIKDTVVAVIQRCRRCLNNYVATDSFDGRVCETCR